MTDAELDQCRHDGALLRSIVADQVKLKREGREWKGLCPFHNETTPSFTVYEDGHFYCYGCGAHGTSFDYVMKRDGVEFPEAAKRVAAEIGAAPSRAKPERRQRQRHAHGGDLAADRPAAGRCAASHCGPASLRHVARVSRRQRSRALLRAPGRGEER